MKNPNAQPDNLVSVIWSKEWSDFAQAGFLWEHMEWKTKVESPLPILQPQPCQPPVDPISIVPLLPVPTF